MDECECRSRLLPVTKKVTTGAWVGEFGWELFCWQAQLRYKAKNESLEMTCITRKGHKLLYQDFAKVRYFDANSYADTYKWHTKVPPKCDFAVCDMTRAPALYVKYGKASEDKKYDILIHARNRKGNRTGDNWKRENWLKLIPELEGKRIATIGTKTQAMGFENTDDLRGIPLSDLADYMASSALLIGSSSGAMHFGSLCNIQSVVWSGVSRTINRYKDIWNPFKTKTFTIGKNHPTADEVLRVMSDAL